ncbi:tRNA pseudouridine(38-40) synthase TruA [Haloarchaeobius iranensis]|uniref:tRNA pseudouridine synthase A n=1 Tax=Haloarchaeobius iranensis TaxID=996166 RepID=A0A1H0APL3_9EURY|nr:tRNA pseudouridine(38-40) synthase TruA [Haloarchaeobius iranensis]SDN35013.1 tRNA pseudouridine38-40 synthase [Haloarchaeobius iranensis]
MPRRAFRVAYDGRPFHGFQRQPSVPTVEGALFDALRELGVLADDAPKPPGYAAAGRTDAGVFGLGQTVAFDAPEWLTPRAFNGELPATVRTWAHADAPADFHATHDAASRAYEYHLYAPDADLGLARAAVDRLRGTHDFRDLSAVSSGNTARTLTAATVERDGEFLVLGVRGDGFLHELVRRLVSLVRSVAVGSVPVERVEGVLAPGTLPDHEIPPPAPSGGLVFVDAAYPGLAFAPDHRGAASVAEVFGDRAAKAATRGRLCRRVADGVRED